MVPASAAAIEDKSHGRVSRAMKALRDLGPRGVIRLLREHGVSKATAFVTRNIRYSIADGLARRWDRKHGVDTAGSVQLKSLTIIGPNGDAGNECLCTSPKTFDFMMSALPLSVDDYTFIDIGSGKSRTLLLASRYNFHKIVGVEFARELVNISQDNLLKFKASWQRTKKLEVVHADAAQYILPDGPLVIFLYNPFSKEVFEAVLQNTLTSLAQNYRDCYIIFSSSSANAIEWARPTILRSAHFDEVETKDVPLFLDAIRTVRWGAFKVKPQEKLPKANKLS